LKHSKINFKTELDFEKTLSEYKRVTIFIFVLAFGFILSILNYLFDSFGLKMIVRYETSNLAIVLCLFFILNYEIIFLLLLKRYIRLKKILPESIKITHSLIEILFPGILLYMLMVIEQRPVFLDSPFLFVYFILIAISALQLNFKISFFTGLFAALQYVFLIQFAFHYIMPGSDIKLPLPQSIYYIRAVILLIAGAASGLIALEINRRVSSSFKQMDETQKIISLFGQQVSKEIVDELIKRKDELDVRRCDATIMFLDIRNFSSYAETKEPAEIIKFQNNIFNPLIEVITKHHGIVNQFLGDGFMASFGIPISKDTHVQDAYNAGLEIINKLNELAEQGIIPKTRVGIGIHCGEVITGNIGNDIRKQYSIAGTTVITSARIEQLNKQFQTQYLITRDVMDKVNLNGQQAESLGETTVKGFEKPLEVICVRV
jgi:adenylate cyclase